MPVKKCGNGKYQIGDGPCMYTSKEKAVSAYQAYLAKEKDNSEQKKMKLDDMDLKDLMREKNEFEKLAKETNHPGHHKMLKEITKEIESRNNKMENDMDLKNKKIAVLKSNASAKIKLAAVKRLDNDYNAKKNEALKAKINSSEASDEVKKAALKRLNNADTIKIELQDKSALYTDVEATEIGAGKWFGYFATPKLAIEGIEKKTGKKVEVVKHLTK